MTPEQREIRQSYSRGYYAGQRGFWPAWMPPTVPDEQQQNLIECASDLAGRVDDMFATFGEEDREADFMGLESARVRVLKALAGIRAAVIAAAGESEK